MFIVDEFVIGGDGLKIKTKNGFTSRPITKLYPLVNGFQEEKTDHQLELPIPAVKVAAVRPIREANVAALKNIKSWTKAKS